MVLYSVLLYTWDLGKEGRNRVTVFDIKVDGEGTMGSGLLWAGNLPEGKLEERTQSQGGGEVLR